MLSRAKRKNIKFLSFFIRDCLDPREAKACICNIKRGWVGILRADRSLLSNTDDSADSSTQPCGFSSRGQ